MGLIRLVLEIFLLVLVYIFFYVRDALNVMEVNYCNSMLVDLINVLSSAYCIISFALDLYFFVASHLDI